MVLNLFGCCCSQIDVSGNRKAVVIHVPYRLRKAFRKVHVRLVRELEKKFSGKVTISHFLPAVTGFVYVFKFVPGNLFVRIEPHFVIVFKIIDNMVMQLKHFRNSNDELPYQKIQ